MYDDYYEDEYYEDDELECRFIEEYLCKAPNGHLYLEIVTAWSSPHHDDSYYWQWETEYEGLRDYKPEFRALAVAWARSSSPGASIKVADLIPRFRWVRVTDNVRLGVMKWEVAG